MTALPPVNSDDFYARLGVDRTASADEIKSAYRALLRRFPPESKPEEFKRIREAYETLSNSVTRHEYDDQPDPAVHRMLFDAQRAIESHDYAAAERLLKQVLLQVPTLDWVRNMLGLCFLYQGDAPKAVVQYERLLAKPDALAVWFGNAAHAYQMLKRYTDAEWAFAEALRRTTDNPSHYYIGMADVCIEQELFARAASILESGIQADGTVDFQDLRYFTRLLEVRVRESSESGVEEVLTRISNIAADDEQRRLAALELGRHAVNLTEVGRYSMARMIAACATMLAPDDRDYAALHRAAWYLSTGNISSLRKLISAHASFGHGGWLQGLGKSLRPIAAEHLVAPEVEPLRRAPTLWTVNGIGTKLYGHRDDDSHTGSYVATLYFAFLFVPIFPIASYRVVDRAGGWGFLGKVPFSKKERRHLAIGVGSLVLFVFWGLIQDSVSAVGKSSPTVQPELPAFGSLTPSAATGGASTANDQNSGWYATERANVESLESEVSVFDARLAVVSRDVEQMDSQIRAIEGGFGVYKTSDPEYSSLIVRRNASADNYNAILQRRKFAYDTYVAALAAFNTHVDETNARRR